MLLLRKLIWSIATNLVNFPGKERLFSLISRPSKIRKAKIIREGVAFEIHGHDINEFVLAIRKNHSPLLSLTLCKEIRNNNITRYWDIGANIGAVSFPLINKFKNLHVTMFEPSVEVAGRLIKNLTLNRKLSNRISIFNIALSDFNGFANFYISNEEYNSGVAGLSPSQNREDFPINIQTYKGDDLILSNKCLCPQLIKIDVEGHELEVLRGLKNTLLKSHPIIVFEHSQYRFTERGQQKNLVTNYLESLGYVIYNQETDLPITQNDLNIDGDFIAKQNILRHA